jgi:hypothetical protein
MSETRLLLQVGHACLHRHDCYFKLGTHASTDTTAFCVCAWPFVSLVCEAPKYLHPRDQCVTRMSAICHECVIRGNGVLREFL